MLYNIININILNNNILLDIIGILSIITALLIILVANPMYSILYLIFLFIYIAIYLYLIGISIMSLLYLLVYIGAIAVLFLFILSLLNNKDISSIESDSIKNEHNLYILSLPSKSIPLILLIIYYLYNNINIIINNNLFNLSLNNTLDVTKEITLLNNNNNLINIENNIKFIINNNWYNIIDINHLNQIGFLLYTEYSILFIWLSILLLFSIISAIVLIKND